VVTGLEVDLVPVTWLYGGSLFFDADEAKSSRVCAKSWERGRLARPRRVWERRNERVTGGDALALRGWPTHAHRRRGRARRPRSQ